MPKETIQYDHVRLHPDEQIDIHHQSSWEMSYIIKGSGSRILGNSEESFKAGEVVLIVPEMPHQWKFNADDTDADGKIENITIMFPADFLQQLAANIPEYSEIASWFDGLRSSIKFARADADSISTLLRRMEFELPHERVNTLLQILSEIYRGNGRFTFTGRFVENRSTPERKLKAILIYLTCNCRHDISLNDVARHVGMNRSAVCTFFKRHTGQTIMNRLISMRIEMAKHLLETEDISVSQCCYRSGFNDVPHFNRTFKKLTGFSPKAWLRNEKR